MSFPQGKSRKHIKSTRSPKSIGYLAPEKNTYPAGIRRFAGLLVEAFRRSKRRGTNCAGQESVVPVKFVAHSQISDFHLRIFSSCIFKFCIFLIIYLPIVIYSPIYLSFYLSLLLPLYLPVYLFSYPSFLLPTFITTYLSSCLSILPLIYIFV